MRWGLALTLVTAMVVQGPALNAARQLTLEVRVFNGGEEVTGQVRATVHRAGDRGEPLLSAGAGLDRLLFRLAAGIYDVQAIHEREGRVLNIRWANRLVVMPYPDEPGHHSRSSTSRTGRRLADSGARRSAAGRRVASPAGRTNRRSTTGRADCLCLSCGQGPTTFSSIRRQVRVARGRGRPRPHAPVGNALMTPLDAELIQRLLLAAVLGASSASSVSGNKKPAFACVS
jgi:hypothetical protein